MFDRISCGRPQHAYGAPDLAPVQDRKFDAQGKPAFAAIGATKKRPRTGGRQASAPQEWRRGPRPAGGHHDARKPDDPFHYPSMLFSENRYPLFGIMPYSPSVPIA